MYQLFKPATLSVAVLGLMSASVWAEQSDSEPSVTLEPMIVSVSGVGRTLEKGPGSVTSINADEIRHIGANNMADVVKYQPLVAAPSASKASGNAWDGTGTTGYNIRGMDGNRVGLDVDGVELPDAAAKPDSVSRTFTKLNNSYGMGRDYIDPEMFREVRIQAGSTDARTDGLAGRVSFLTKKASDYVNDNKTTAAGYKIGYDGADKSVQHAAHGAVGSDTLRALVVYSRRDGEEVQANTNIALEPNDWRSDAALLNVQYQPNDHQCGGGLLQ